MEPATGGRTILRTVTTWIYLVAACSLFASGYIGVHPMLLTTTDMVTKSAADENFSFGVLRIVLENSKETRKKG